MHQHIFNDNGILGKVTEYVIQYELQHYCTCSYYFHGLIKMI
jgi:hypothetical protein